MAQILNFNKNMEYRRFGKTNVQLSVITLGGMRFKHGWSDPRHEIPADTLKQCIDTVQLAFDHGINHIETAWGYKKSETVYGKVLNEELKIPRNSYHLMTKGHSFNADEMRKLVEKQLEDLQTDYFDFYGWHGLNNEELFKAACKKGGAVEALVRMKEEGIIKHVGFSTHAPLHTIISAINTGLFEFVNLHYYYFNQRNEQAILAAQNSDMGVFIISPNDKGGQLFKAPEKVRNAVKPLTPIQWNTRFCLQNTAIHTLTFGMTEESHFKEMKGIFPVSVPWSEEEQKSKETLDSFLNDDPYSKYDGFELENDPSELNIPEMLRLRKLWKCYDMVDYGRYRYKTMGENSHWLYGGFATNSRIESIDNSKIPANVPLKKMLKETHKELYVPEYKLVKKIQHNLKKISGIIKN